MIRDGWQPILKRVNAEVNANPYAEEEIDDWQPALPGQPRDCDSSAVEKVETCFRALVGLGFEAKGLRLGWVLVEPLEDPKANRNHLLAVVSTPEGPIALDIRHAEPMPVENLWRLGYEPQIIQHEGGSLRWRRWVQ